MPLFSILRTSSRQLVAVAVALTVIGGMACGGGGGGGGNPVMPPPPPTTTACSSNSNVRITVTGFNDPNVSFEGTMAEIVGHGTSTVNANNEVCFDNVAAGTRQAEFTGSNHLTRRVELNVLGGVVNHFDNVDLVEPGPFDLAAFDEIYRSFSVEGTVRWKTRPTRIMLDRDSLGSLEQGLDFFEDNVRRSYNSWLPNNTGGFFSNTPVTVGSIGTIDPDNFSCNDVPIGEIHIVGIDECPMEENFIILGTATHCFNSVGNEVLLGAIFFNPCTTVATIEHEIIHTLCAGHLESRPNASIMGSPGGSGQILPLDRRHMRYLYGRPAGVQTPDDAWGLDALVPMTSSGGSFLSPATGDLFAPNSPQPTGAQVLDPSRVSPHSPLERQPVTARDEH